jgi:TolA-binding protein
VLDGRAAVVPSPGVRSSPAPAARTSTREGGAGSNDAETYYRRAEVAMKRGDGAAARAELSALVAHFPGDVLVSSARYELARLSAEAGDRGAARHHLMSLLEHPARDAAIVELARALVCDLDTDEARTDAAIACWSGLRADYPRSPHDRRALVELARLTEARGGCVEARPWLELLVGLYPRDEAGRAASERLQRCGR